MHDNDEPKPVTILDADRLKQQDICLLSGDAAASGIGPTGAIAKEIKLAEMLIAGTSKPQPDALADPGRRLKEWVRGPI